MLYGILKSYTNTGQDSELQNIFVAPLAISSNQPTFVQDTLSLQRRASMPIAQRWEIMANLFPENGTNNHMLHSVTYGNHGIIYVRMPQIANKALSNSTILAADAAINASSISLVGTIAAGEFINVGTDPKVYLITAANGGIVQITPKLRTAQSMGAAVKAGGNVTMRAYYDTDVQLGITFTDGVLSDPGSIKLIEALQ